MQAKNSDDIVWFNSVLIHFYLFPRRKPVQSHSSQARYCHRCWICFPVSADVWKRRGIRSELPGRGCKEPGTRGSTHTVVHSTADPSGEALTWVLARVPWRCTLGALCYLSNEVQSSRVHNKPGHTGASCWGHQNTRRNVSCWTGRGLGRANFYAHSKMADSMDTINHTQLLY